MENKETFDAIASDYDKYRPTYPDDLFEDLISYTGIKRTASILEIGCGTGQATSGLVNRGLSNITCIEFGSNLAKITSEKYKNYSTIKVINSSFEDWNGEENSYDLAISATAFHFIEPNYGYQKVSGLLRSTGSMGFFWTVHVPLYDEIHNQIRNIYKRYAPHLDDSIKAHPEEVIHERRRLTENNGLFDNIIVKEYRWIETYNCEDYISLINTHSKHQQLSKDLRDKLFTDMKNIINKHGGYINKQQLVALFLGKKSSIILG